MTNGYFIFISLDPPFVSPLSKQDIIEGRDLSVTCSITPGNPSSSTIFWTKVGLPGFRQEGPTLQLPGINRTSSGNYSCTAENKYNNDEKGTADQSMVVNVLCKYHLSFTILSDFIMFML
jgi:hypothetical protein